MGHLRFADQHCQLNMSPEKRKKELRFLGIHFEGTKISIMLAMVYRRRGSVIKGNQLGQGN